MTRRLHPGARNAALAKVTRWTVGAVALSVVSTLGLGTAIAMSAPAPEQSQPDFTDPAKPAKKQQQPKKRQASKTSELPTVPDQSPTFVPPDGGGVERPPVTIAPPEDRPESSIGDEDTTTGGS